jgi:hypothetical protein
MSYIDQFSVKFGTATSVTRNNRSHTSGNIKGFTDGGSYGEVTTIHTTVEQGIILADSGEEYPYSISVNEPYLRDGSKCALTMRGERPVVITNLSTGFRVWINGGPETDTPHRKNVMAGVVLAIIISGIAFMVLQIMKPWDRTIWNYVPFAVSALLVWRAVKNSQANDINEADRLSKQKLRGELVDTKIAEYKANHASDLTEA